MKSLKIIFFLLAFFGCACSKNINLYKDGKPHGKWKHETSEKDFSKGRYSLGRAVGKWRTVADGKLYRKSKQKNNIEKIKFYHPNGALKSKGIAQVDTLLKMHNDTLMKEVHWYYTGKWLYYSPDHRLLKVETYEQGEWIDDPDKSLP